MPWYKYRERMAYGPGTWEYINVDCPLKEVEQYIEQRLCTWSDKWRGIEIKHVPVPPKHVLFDHLNTARDEFQYAKYKLDELKKQCKKYYKRIPSRLEAKEVHEDFFKEKHRKANYSHKKRMKEAREKVNKIYIANVVTWMRNEARFDVREFKIVQDELAELAKINRLEGFYTLWQKVCQKKYRSRYAQDANIVGDKNDMNSWAAFYLGMTTKSPKNKRLKGLKQDADFSNLLGIKTIEVKVI